MNYTLHQLKIFLKIAELQSVTKAADELHLTQPAVSIQLKRLQDQFDIPLTEVIGRKLYVTDFGKKIVEVSKNVLTEAEAIKTTLDQYRGILTGKIKISVVSTGKYVIPYFLQSFMEKFKGIEVNIDVSNKNKVIETLLNNDTDFSLVSVLPENIPLNTIPLMDNKLYLVGSSRFEGMKLSKESFKDLRLIFRESGSATRNAMEKYLEQQEITSFKSMELVSNEAVKQAVNAGLGFSIMPLIGLKNELTLGTMKIFPLPGLPVITNWNLVYNQGKQLTPASQAFVEHIEQMKSEIVHESFAWSSLDYE